MVWAEFEGKNGICRVYCRIRWIMANSLPLVEVGLFVFLMVRWWYCGEREERGRVGKN